MLLAGIGMIASAVVVALVVGTEVVGGFNVDGLAILLAAVGLLLVIRGLLPSQPELRVRPDRRSRASATPV